MDQPTAMHVARIRGRHAGKDGQEREYESRLLRRTYRDGGKARHETIADMPKMPPGAAGAVEAALKGEALVPAGEAPVTVARPVTAGPRKPGNDHGILLHRGIKERHTSTRTPRCGKLP